MSVRLLLIGGGRMGEALLGGMLVAGRAPGELAVAETIAARRDELAAKYPGVQVVDAPVAAEGVVLATKPDGIAAAARAAVDAGAQRVLSVAAGITTEAIGTAVPVVRAMPNTPALVGAGVTAIAPGSTASEADLDWAEDVLRAVGVVVRVKEAQLDAVTGVSGSGPAYVFLVAEALSDAGVLAGLPRDLANTLAFQTLLGSAQLLLESGEAPATLRAAVTSPGGTTAAGTRELERGGVRSAFLEAVMAATERSRQLGA